MHPIYMEHWSQLRTINVGLLLYYADNKEFPESLQQLIDSGMLDDSEEFELRDSTLHYIPGFDRDDSNKILLYSIPHEIDEYNRIVFCRVDGSSQSIDQLEFLRLLAEQTSEKYTPSESSSKESQ